MNTERSLHGPTCYRDGLASGKQRGAAGGVLHPKDVATRGHGERVGSAGDEFLPSKDEGNGGRVRSELSEHAVPDRHRQPLSGMPPATIGIFFDYFDICKFGARVGASRL